MAPIGLLQLAACLERLGHATIVHDCLGPTAPKGPALNAEQVLATDPDLVGFSATTSGFLDAYEIAVLVKRKRPDLKVIFGGVHVSAMGPALLRLFPEIDYLCLGEGEKLMQDLAECQPLSKILGLAYRDGQKIIVNPCRENNVELDALPFPAYEKLQGFPKLYQLPLFSFILRHGATMVTSRGCPFSCSYCDRTVFGKKYRFNSPQYIWEHMKYLRDRFGVHHVNFYDDLFTLDTDRTLQLCELLAQKPLGMQFNCATRVDQADDSLLSALSRAGCLQISLGIESGAPQLLKKHKRGVCLNNVSATVSRIRRKGMRVKGLFIVGLPGETPSTLRQTSDFIAKTDFDEVNLAKFSPFPGAPVWQECISGQAGEFHQDWRLMNCLNFCFVPKGFRGVGEMDYLYNHCIRRFYKSYRFHQKLFTRAWEHRWSLYQIARNFPAFLYANNQFKPRADQADEQAVRPELHPHQPRPSISASGI
jgi:radical SAM superfamily enzyme YgiQ (UPF0313 family)